MINLYNVAEFKQAGLGTALVYDFHSSLLSNTAEPDRFILVRYCTEGNDCAGLKRSGLCDMGDRIAIIEWCINTRFQFAEFFAAHPAVHLARYQFSVP